MCARAPEGIGSNQNDIVKSLLIAIIFIRLSLLILHLFQQHNLFPLEGLLAVTFTFSKTLRKSHSKKTGFFWKKNRSLTTKIVI
jgi:hypothetical protein